MSTNYLYSREIYDVNALYIYIQATLSNISSISYNAGTITTYWPSALSGGNKTILDGLIISYSNPQVLLSINQFRNISIGNSSSIPLAANSIFTGSWEDVSDYSSIVCTIYSNVGSATNGKSLQFSSDGINIDNTTTYTTPILGDTHVIPVIARYFRIVYTNGSTLQTNFRLQSIYHYYKSATSTNSTTNSLTTLNSTITDSNTATLSRTVLVGKQSSNGTYNNLTLNNLNELAIDVPRTAFGEITVAELTPVVQYDFTYAINSDMVSTVLTGSGNAVQDGTVLLSLSTGSTTNSSASLLSKRCIRYKPGQGARGVWSAIYTQGVLGSTQYAGLGTDLDGYFIGFNGTQFTTLRRANGTEYFTPQSSWNTDKLDGTGSSGMTLDPTKGNIFMINFQWYGFGTINWYISDWNTARFILVHKENYENRNITTSTQNNIFPVYYKVTNTTNNMNIILKSSSFAGFIEGKIYYMGPQYGIDASKAIQSTNFTPILTIRNRSIFNAKKNWIPIHLQSMSIAGNNSQPIIIVLCRNSILTNTSYQNINTINSCIEYDTSADTIQVGSQIQTMVLNVNGVINYNLIPNNIILVPGEYITIAAKFISAGNASLGVSLNWFEDQ
jgi:hypothetical protein